MSILLDRAKRVDDAPLDEIYVIYGNNGTGKTVLASTFPKTKEAPMLYLDFLEGGTKSISKENRENLLLVEINDYRELDSVLTDVINGYTISSDNKKIPIKFSTIVFDSATQLEYLMKKALMKAEGKNAMNLNLWGQARQQHDNLGNLCKLINQKTGAKIVVICHQKEITDEENPGNNKIIPSIMNSAAYGLCAKASFVWYTKIENLESIDPETKKLNIVPEFVTYIDSCQAYLTKSRRPQEIQIPQKVKNLTYDKFKTNVLNKIY